MTFRGVEHYRKWARRTAEDHPQVQSGSVVARYVSDVTTLCDRIERLEGKLEREKTLAPRHEAPEELMPPWRRDE